MTTGPQDDPRTPWWSSGADGPRPPSDDPLTAHRAARRGDHDLPSHDVADHDAPGHDAPAGADTDDAGPRAASATGQSDDPSASEPWWGSAADHLVRLVRDASEAAHAQAVANAREAGGVRAPAAEPGTRPPPDDRPGDGGPHDQAGHAHAPDDAAACRLCPLCAGMRALGEHRPELLGHLAEAARHLSLAARTVLDAQPPSDGDRDDDGLEHIDLQ